MQSEKSPNLYYIIILYYIILTFYLHLNQALYLYIVNLIPIYS